MARRSEAEAGRTEREAYYAELLEEQEESGLSVTAFAAQSGVSAGTLYSWRRRLAHRGEIPRREVGARLVEVLARDESVPAEGQGRMTLIAAGGARIELDADFNDAALERLLGVLERC